MCASCNRCFFKRMILYFLHKIYDRLLLENSHCLCWRLKAGSNCPQFQGGFFTGEHRILPPGKRWTLMWPLRMNIPKDISCRGKYQTSISQSKGCSWSGHIGCQWKMALGTCQPKAHLVDCSSHSRTSDSRKNREKLRLYNASAPSCKQQPSQTVNKIKRHMGTAWCELSVWVCLLILCSVLSSGLNFLQPNICPCPCSYPFSDPWSFQPYFKNTQPWSQQMSLAYVWPHTESSTPRSYQLYPLFMAPSSSALVVPTSVTYRCHFRGACNTLPVITQWSLEDHVI